jgi:hypothetical protein
MKTCTFHFDSLQVPLYFVPNNVDITPQRYTLPFCIPINTFLAHHAAEHDKCVHSLPLLGGAPVC